MNLRSRTASSRELLDAVKIEANGQVIADFGNSEDGDCCCISPTRTPTSGNLRTGMATTLAPVSVEQEYKYNFGLTTDSGENYTGSCGGPELSNFKVNKAKAKDKTVKLVEYLKWLASSIAIHI